jgi:hypothetical protein
VSPLPRVVFCQTSRPFSCQKRHRKPSNKKVDCTVSTQTTALFRATNFFQKESKLLFYQLIKVYSYEPPSPWFILRLSSKYQLKIYMKIEKSYLSFHIKLDWESTNMIVPV